LEKTLDEWNWKMQFPYPALLYCSREGFEGEMTAVNIQVRSRQEGRQFNLDAMQIQDYLDEAN
jgi:hypothetical protein